MFHEGVKHIDIRQYYIRVVNAQGNNKVSKVDTNENLVDITAGPEKLNILKGLGRTKKGSLSLL